MGSVILESHLCHLKDDGVVAADIVTTRISQEPFNITGGAISSTLFCYVGFLKQKLR